MNDGWIEHSGLKDPDIPGDTFVQVMFRDGDDGHCGSMHDWDENWQWTPDNTHRRDIIAYRRLAVLIRGRERYPICIEGDGWDDIPA